MDNFITPHGENGITFTVFSELNTDEKVQYFIKQTEWIDCNENPQQQGITNCQIHLFPSFGRQHGIGEPDVMILSDSYLFIIEVETEPIHKLPGNYSEQFERFIRLGGLIENLWNNNKKKVGNTGLRVSEDEKFKGRYRTRKLMQDILTDKRKIYYITLTNDHKKDGIKELNKLKNAVVSADDNINMGWIGFYSIKDFGTFNNNDIDQFIDIERIKHVINFNLKD